MKMLQKAIQIGAVGCGYWGPNLIRNLRQLPDCRLKVICDTSEQRLSHMRRLHPALATTHHFEQLLADAELDAIADRHPRPIPLRDGQGLPERRQTRLH